MDILKASLLVVLFIVLIILSPAITMWLWNWLMPSIFELRIINYWEALSIGINVAFYLFFLSKNK